MREHEKYRKIKRKFALQSLALIGLTVLCTVLVVMTGYRSGAQVDLTEQRLFTLTSDTTYIVHNLQEPVRIAAVCETGREEPMVRALLTEYEKASEKIEVDWLDAEKNPSALASYDLGDVVAVYNGSIIVEGPERTKIISSDELFNYTSEGNYFYGEREITGAIRYVTEKELPLVCFLTGHGEVNAGTYLKKATADLTRNAYGVRSLVLLQQEIPEEARILAMISPTEDITAEELVRIRSFMEEGGTFFLTVDPFTAGNQRVFENLNSLVGEYGIDISNNYVVEEDSSYYLTDNDTYLIPRYGSHEITAPIGDMQKMVVLPMARGLGAVQYEEAAVTREILLLTSDKAWARNDMRNMAANWTASDIEGPIAVGFAAQKGNAANRERSSRLVVIGDSDFLTDSGYEMQANSLLFSNSMDWLLGGRETELIAGKVMNAERIFVRGSDFMKLTVICCAVLPMICFVAAFLWWKLRRNG